MLLRPAWLLVLLTATGCFPPGEGIDPPATRLYFPVGVALDESASHLFIVNSDFDLQFNAGTVHSWDLAKLRDKVDETLRLQALKATGQGDPNGKDCVNSNDTPVRGQYPHEVLLFPGPCPAISHEEGILVDTVQIGAFATDLIHRSRPAGLSGDPGRLFMPVRGDATLTWIDVQADGRLSCGQTENGGPCASTHRSGDDPAEENTRGLRLLSEPYGVGADEQASVVLVTNQTSGAAGLFLNDWDSGPRYEFTLGGLAERPIGVVSLPEPWAVPALGLPRLPAFLVSYRNAPWVSLVRVYFDEGADPPRPYAKVPNRANVVANSSGVDSRGLAVDGSARREEELRCAERFGLDELGASDPATAQAAGQDYAECVTQASAVPLDVFVTNRSPASLLVGQSRPAIADVASHDLPAFTDSVPLSLGPTRVVVGDILNADGERERRAFAVSFDSRRITIFDPVRGRVEADVTTGRGPQAFVVDEENGFGYVAHFTDSYIGVVDLDQRRPNTYGTIIASFGKPEPPRAAK